MVFTPEDIAHIFSWPSVEDRAVSAESLSTSTRWIISAGMWHASQKKGCPWLIVLLWCSCDSFFWDFQASKPPLSKYSWPETHSSAWTAANSMVHRGQHWKGSLCHVSSGNQRNNSCYPKNTIPQLSKTHLWRSGMADELSLQPHRHANSHLHL